MTIDKNLLDKILLCIREGRVQIDPDAYIDILKQGYSWTEEFIIECMSNGKHFEGLELYGKNRTLSDSEISKRLKRLYCIHKLNIFGKLIIIGYYFRDDVLIIHISPLNQNSAEGKIYYGKLQ
ncbi:MAG: hypothetical protein HZB67_03120 [Candidatus Aenigmarchaeota archaeon]|nr:hypothetical protein [Candidatus Aenigmarchaeota archaeon]